MKKLLLFLFLSITIPTITMQLPQIPAELDIPDPITRERVSLLGLTTNDTLPDNKKVIDQIILSTDDPSARYSAAELEMHRFKFKPELVDKGDTFGRTAIWWAAALSKDKEYDALLKLGANPNIKPFLGTLSPYSGPLSTYSAKDLHEMNPYVLEAKIRGYKPHTTQSEWIFIGDGTVMNAEGFMRDM